MGVDYTANYGIGFLLNIPSNEELEEMELDVDSYLEDILPSNTSYFEVGGGNYTGEQNDYYVILDDDEINETLTERCEDLKVSLLNEGLINSNDKASVVGGLKIW